jgi:hypothetical protein
MSLPDGQFALRVRTMQIFAATLCGGVAIFAAIALYLVDQDGPLGQVPAPGDLPILSVAALVMLGICVPLGLFLPNMILRGTLQRIAAGTWTPPPVSVDAAAGPSRYASDEARLLQARQTLMIIACALLESAGMLAAMAYLLEGQSFALTTTAVALALMLFQFPTQGRVRDWLERHVAIVAELRQLGGPPR